MRKKRNYKRERKPDALYNNIAVSRFINYLMIDGKKSIAEKNLYLAFKVLEKEKHNPIEIFEKAVQNAMPLVEVASKRIGGANYQVPREVRPERKFMLACKWIIESARSKKGKGITEKLVDELLQASKNEGAAIKKKQDIHRMAESNRVFGHFSW